MGRLIVFLFLLMKHAFFANGVDVGYSVSRHQHSHILAWYYLSYQILLEAMGSLMLLGFIYLSLRSYQLWRWETFMLAEGMGQALAWGMERRAKIDRLFATHVTAELSFLALYAILTIVLYPF